MAKTAKEIAFLRGLTVEPEWTQKFTDYFDEVVKIGDPLTITYLNAGAGNHAIELAESLGAKVQIFPVCETIHLQKNAQIKADATKVAIDFSTTQPMAESDYVITDATLLKGSDIDEAASKTVAASCGRFAFILPTSGSYGEVFSILWETLAELGIKAADTEIERLIKEQPTLTDLEEMFKLLGIKKADVHTKAISFDFESGKEFVESPLVSSFLMPFWVGFLSKKDKERVVKQLAQKIDDDRQDMTFRFSVKATVITGKVVKKGL